MKKLLLLASLAASASAPVQDPVRIHGRVLLPGGSPAEGAVVTTILVPAGPGETPTYPDESGAVDAAGRFEFPTWNATLFYAIDWEQRLGAIVPRGEDGVALEIVLAPLAEVRGQVVATDTSPDAPPIAYQVTRKGGAWPVVYGTTPGGALAFPLPRGKYQLFAGHEGRGMTSRATFSVKRSAEPVELGAISIAAPEPELRVRGTLRGYTGDAQACTLGTFWITDTHPWGGGPALRAMRGDLGATATPRAVSRRAACPSAARRRSSA